MDMLLVFCFVFYVLWRYCMDREIWRSETGQEFIDFLRVSNAVSMIFLQNVFFSSIWQT